MLVYKAAQVVASQPYHERPYKFKNDAGEMVEGVSKYSDVTVLGTGGAVAVIRFKGKTPEEVTAKVAKLTIGKAAEIPILGMEDSARGVMVLNA